MPRPLIGEYLASQIAACRCSNRLPFGASGQHVDGWGRNESSPFLAQGNYLAP